MRKKLDPVGGLKPLEENHLLDPEFFASILRNVDKIINIISPIDPLLHDLASPTIPNLVKSFKTYLLRQQIRNKIQ